MSLSVKQLTSFAESDARINLWCGAVRSGKTYSSILKFIHLLKSGPPGNAIIVGVSRESVQNNVVNDLCEMLGCPVISSKNNDTEILGRRVRIIGAHDAGSVRKIQGSTLSIAYVDEAAVVPKPFWNMLLSRLSKEGATLLATCNPEGPAHWLKKEWVDRSDELDMKYFQFKLDDNPSLPQAYKDNIKKEYTGAWYNRLILGEWAVAEGLVYDSFDEDNIVDHKPHNADYYICGIDYGITNPTAAVMIAVHLNKFPRLCVEDIYYYNSKENLRAKVDWELANDLEEWMRPYNVNRVYMDPSAASLKLEMQRRQVLVSEAKNDVLPGIKGVAKMLASKELVINSKCKKLIEEIQTYSWDPKAADRGEDKPMKENDHILDALRYALFSQFPYGLEHGQDKDYSISAVRQRAYGESQDVQSLLAQW